MMFSVAFLLLRRAWSGHLQTQTILRALRVNLIFAKIAKQRKIYDQTCVYWYRFI